MHKNIEDYGIIGNLRTVALIGKDGSVDFMCCPDFDSPSIFAALLDEHKGGHFKISPILEEGNERQQYLPDTNILFTRWLAKDGVAEISDFMPIQNEPSPDQPYALVRRVKTVRGNIRYRVNCHPRFNYGRGKHTIKKVKEGLIFQNQETAHPMTLILRTAVDTRVHKDAVTAEFSLKAGESQSFILEHLDDATARNSPCARENYVPQAFKETVNYWRNWIRRSKYKGRWQEMVDRSTLLLKLFISRRYGSVIASPTFGLPEDIGGERNWDYRYCWLRDSSLIFGALLRLGYVEETRMFMEWLHSRCAHKTKGNAMPLKVLYRINGETNLDEKILSHWQGHKKSTPVRIGNNAHKQRQLDVYGEMLDMIDLFDVLDESISYDFWQKLLDILKWVSRHWKDKDEGIWEIRGAPYDFLYSKFMCWVAFDRALRIAQRNSFPAPIETWRKTRDTIYEEIMKSYWNKKKNSFIQIKGTGNFDAANLMMPLSGFISPTDPRWLKTLKGIEQHLIDDSHVYRYRNTDTFSDRLKGKEGTFCMCTFWYVQCLAKAGDIEQARFIFEKMLGYANHLGLYAEQIGLSGNFLGNFPQAFTHVSLINTAIELNELFSRRSANLTVEGGYSERKA